MTTTDERCLNGLFCPDHDMVDVPAARVEQAARAADYEAAIAQRLNEDEHLTTVAAVQRRLENGLARQAASALRATSDGTRASLWSQVGMADKLLGLMATTPEARALYKRTSQEAYRRAAEAIARTEGKTPL